MTVSDSEGLKGILTDQYKTFFFFFFTSRSFAPPFRCSRNLHIYEFGCHTKEKKKERFVRITVTPNQTSLSASLLTEISISIFLDRRSCY